MTLTLTELVSLTGCQSSRGRRYIDLPFAGNRLAVHLRIIPNLDRANTVIGVLTQHFGAYRRDYQIRASQTVLGLLLPQTDFLSFFPISSLYDEYGLDLAYTTVGDAVSEPSIIALPESIALLPDRVASLEATRTEMISHLVNIDTAIEAIENAPTSVSWESVVDKPTTFTPSIHTHSFVDITGLGETLGTWELMTLDLTNRVEVLESAIPIESGSISTVLLSTNSTLESNKRYLATVANLVCALPSTPSNGDVIEIQTDNYDVKIANGNASQRVLNSNTLTSIGIDSGIILKPYSYISLMYIGANLWVSQVRSRVINNFSPVTQEPTATKKTYTATAPVSSYGAVIAKMYDGVKTVGSITAGYLSDVTSGNILITLSEPIIIDQIRVWNGQGNVGAGGGSGYRLNDMIVYTGHTLDGQNLGTYTFNNVTASEQVKTITPNTSASNTFLLRCNSITPITMGIIELEIWGKGSLGGEVSAP